MNCCGLLPIALNCFVIVLLGFGVLAIVTIFWLVYHPFHRENAPVECFGAYLLLLWFVVLGWYSFPFFVLPLEALVCLFLLVLVTA